MDVVSARGPATIVVVSDVDVARSVDLNASAVKSVIRIHFSKTIARLSIARLITKAIVARLQRKPILIISQDVVESHDEASLFLSIY